jgi:phage terminase large subunit-like protein
VDADVDWTTPEALQMANPNYGVSVSEEFLLAEQRKAIQSAYLQNNFKTKHLNIWCSSSAAYFNMQSLEACIDTTLDIEDFRGEECIIALDLASKIDIAGLVSVFKRETGGIDHYYAFCKAYLPDETAYDPKQKQYQGWANSGLLTITSGNIIDYEWIERDLLQWAGDFDVLEVPFDPWNATQIALRMGAEGLTMVEIQQNVRNLSAPMKELDALIRGKRFHFDGNIILKWMFSNVVAKTDANDNVFPRKERNENKIDLVVALLMAMGRWLAQDTSGGSVYEERLAKGGNIFSSV